MIRKNFGMDVGGAIEAIALGATKGASRSQREHPRLGKKAKVRSKINE